MFNIKNKFITHIKNVCNNIKPQGLDFLIPSKTSISEKNLGLQGEGLLPDLTRGLVESVYKNAILKKSHCKSVIFVPSPISKNVQKYKQCGFDGFG